jgi:hypothetical protein
MYTKDAFLYLILLGGLTIACCILLFFTFPESPKFLYSKGRYEELKHSFETIKRWNKTQNVNVDQLIDDLKEAKSHAHAYKGSFFKDLKVLYNST